jgi:hypothetical protein
MKTSVLAVLSATAVTPMFPPGTHRTFSLLPHPLIPYSPYALETSVELAAVLTEHAGNAYQTSQALASRYENLNPDPGTLTRIKHRLLEALRKLKPLPQKLQQMINPPGATVPATWAEFITVVNNYQSQVVVAVAGVCALSHDWFYVFQEHQPCMQRDFLFGTPSQKRLCA